MSKSITNEEFVIAWQSSKSLVEVARLLKVTQRQASLRAAHMRKAGVPLQKFKEVGERLDVEKLSRLAERTKR